MPTLKNIVIGLAVIGVLLCGFGIWFVNWANSEAGQATFREVETRQAMEAATQAAVEEAQATAIAQIASTVTAAAAQFDTRLASAELIFEEDFAENSPFITQKNVEERYIFFDDGIPQVSFGFPGSELWTIDQEVGDFIAEVDCGTSGKGTYCGIVYGIHYAADDTEKTARKYYASFIKSPGHCGFDDLTSWYSVSDSDLCSYGESPAASTLHRLRVERIGPIMRFYVNGNLIEERILENSASQMGEIGVYIGRQDPDQSLSNYLKIDSFKVWRLP